MNRSALPYLVSPIGHQSLALVDSGLMSAQTGELYPIVEGIPLLQPLGQATTYLNEALDVVFGQHSMALLQELCNMDDGQMRHDTVRNHLHELGSKSILSAFRSYAALSQDKRLKWLAAQDPQCVVPQKDLENGRKYASREYAEERVGSLVEKAGIWAIHLSQYVSEVFANHPKAIVELSSGAGMGTNALIQHGLNGTRLFAVDIEYVCGKIVEGIANWNQAGDWVDPLAGNFWFLPFKDESVQTVCAHYGLDEAREIGQVLTEIGRVLMPKGRFVNVSRRDSILRLQNTFRDLDFTFTSGELDELVRMGNLYPGPEPLGELAKRGELRLVEMDVISPATSHERVLSVFEKA